MVDGNMRCILGAWRSGVEIDKNQIWKYTKCLISYSIHRLSSLAKRRLLVCTVKVQVFVSSFRPFLLES
jgi:hypothetical protein